MRRISVLERRPAPTTPETAWSSVLSTTEPSMRACSQWNREPCLCDTSEEVPTQYRYGSVGRGSATWSINHIKKRSSGAGDAGINDTLLVTKAYPGSEHATWLDERSQPLPRRLGVHFEMPTAGSLGWCTLAPEPVASGSSPSHRSRSHRCPTHPRSTSRSTSRTCRGYAPPTPGCLSLSALH